MPDISPLDLGLAVPIGMLVRAIVRYLQPVWSKVDPRLSGLINLAVSFVFGILFSFAWTGYASTGQGVGYKLGLGILAAAVAVLYNDLRTGTGMDEQRGSGVGVLKVVKDLKTKVVKKDNDEKKGPAPKVGSVTPQQ